MFIKCLARAPVSASVHRLRSLASLAQPSSKTNSDLLRHHRSILESSGEVKLHLTPSSPGTPLVAGHVLFHPSDTAMWLERWREERPEDGDRVLDLLMGPGVLRLWSCPLEA